ncbi:hypothetical protein BH11ARM1_BH11ARM1_01880 [soil metagenome]
MKYEYAWSSSNRWVDTTGKNESMGDRNSIMLYARNNGWELITVAEGTFYFKRPFVE